MDRKLVPNRPRSTPERRPPQRRADRGEPAPLYFPRLRGVREPEVPDGTAESIAFILSGVAPEERLSRHRMASGVTLRQLLREPGAQRVGPTTTLRDDHVYILSPRYDFERVDFDTVWQEAKVVNPGQDSTDLRSLVKQLRRLRLDPEGKILADRGRQPEWEAYRRESARLLHYLFRSAIRHIEEEHRRPEPPPEGPTGMKGWLKKLGLAKRKATPVEIQPEVLDQATRYLQNALKLARILRG